jgi:hypothetical protein
MCVSGRKKRLTQKQYLMPDWGGQAVVAKRINKVPHKYENRCFACIFLDRVFFNLSVTDSLTVRLIRYRLSNYLSPERNLTMKSNHNRPVRFETLEDRKMMAGNITASVVNEELVLNGDGAGNQVEVHQTVGNLYKVKGLNGTTINGKADKSFIFEKGIRVDLKGGDDEFSMGGLVFFDDVDGNLNINMGAGKDKVNLGRVIVDGDTNIDTSTEDDIVNFSTASLRKLTLNTGAGSDSVSMGFSSTSQANINMDLGNDAFVYGGSTSDSIKVDTGSGDDRVEFFLGGSTGNIDILTGNNKDSVKLQALQASNINVDTAGGDDSVDLAGGIVAAALNIKTGTENDSVNFNAANIRSVLSLDTADGNDRIKAIDTTFEKLFDLKTGSGNDVVELNRTKALRRVSIDTAAGDDTVDLIDVIANGQVIDIKTGDNQDKVSLIRVVADQLLANLGNGNDELRIKNSTFKITKLDGGANSDAFFDLLGNNLGALTLESF